MTEDINRHNELKKWRCGLHPHRWRPDPAGQRAAAGAGSRPPVAVDLGRCPSVRLGAAGAGGAGSGPRDRRGGRLHRQRIPGRWSTAAG